MDKVSFDDFKAAIQSRRYSELLERPEVFPSQTNWEYIIERRMTESGIGRLLYRKYLVAMLTPEADRVDYHTTAIEFFPKYLDAIGYKEAVDVVYSDLTTLPADAVRLVEKHHLMAVERLLEMIEAGDGATAISLLWSFKPEYTRDDLSLMELLHRRLTSLPMLGQVVTSRGMFREQERYICPRGHSNSGEREFCSHGGCGLNIYGLTQPQVEAIEEFGRRVGILRHMLS